MKILIQSLRLMLVLTILTGVVYPLAVTAVGGGLFSEKAGGSFITKQGQVVGSSLIGQKFESPRYFRSRPSGIDYNPAPSGGTNLAPTSKKLQESVQGLRKTLGDQVPKELLYASASGVDPHISPAAALYQIDAVAQGRGFDEGKKEALRQLVEVHTHGRDLGFLGEETVNVLELNLSVDKM